MLLIPVIDIKDGKSVRMIEGLADKTVYYSESPLSMARLFRKENFKVLQITDLDGAYHGEMKNYELIRHITESVGIPVQLGGGIRNYDVAKKLIEDLGVYRIILATAAVDNLPLVEKLVAEYSSSKVIVSIDVRDGYLVKTRWTERTDIKGIDLALKIKAIGIQRIIYQDVSRIGTLKGPNLSGLKEMAEATGLKITAAGGIGGYPDLKKLQQLEPIGVDSAILSRALYENKFPCQAIWRNAEKNDTSLELPNVR
jgi:phosphoribosylformimino-5-aminoimidazole carboxamide ribotide isomerase